MLLMTFWRHHHCGRQKIKNNELYALAVRGLYEGGYGGRLLTPPVYCPCRYTTGGVEAEQAVVVQTELLLVLARNIQARMI
jgi:hypothetical protein